MTLPGTNTRARRESTRGARPTRALSVASMVMCVVIFVGTAPLPAAAAPLLVATVTVGDTPVGVAANPETNRIYVTNRFSNDVSVIDGATNSVIATIPNNQVPQGVAVNAATNRVYVSELGRGLSIIDGSSNTPLARVPVGAGAFTVAVNQTTNRIYVPSFNDHYMSVIDGTTNTVLTTITLGGNPSGVAVNPRTNRIYVTNYGLGNVAVIDGATNAVTDIISTGGNPSHIAVNSVTDRLYVTGAPSFAVIDAASKAVIARLDLGSADEVVVNELLDRAYITRIGVNKLSVVDGRTNTHMGETDLRSFTAGLSVNPRTSNVYIAKFFDRAVAVFHDADVAPPSISAAISPTPNSGGWNREDVTVRWTVSDPSGIASSAGCEERTLTTETAGTTLTCTATNLGGGTATESVSVKLDKTAPAINITASTADGSAYTAGTWTNQNVIVHHACSDSLSGLVTFCGDVIHTIETATGMSVATATDAAGNTATATFGPIRIDKSRPTIRGIGSTSDGQSYFPGAWTNQTVTVRFVCGDFWSGVATCSEPQEVSGPETMTVLTRVAIDNASNRAESTFGPVLVDKVAPSIEATATTSAGTPYTAGTWTNQGVTVHFDCADTFSGVFSCTPDQTFIGDGPVDSTTGAATDRANNRTTRSFGPILIDGTAPTIIFAGNQGIYTVDQIVVITCTAEDATSGIASTSCPTVASAPATDFVSGTSTTTSLTASASDAAGNTASATTSFTVIVSADGICRLASGINGNAVCTFARNIASSTNASAKTHALDAFDAYLQSQSEKAIPHDLAVLLSQLSRFL